MCQRELVWLSVLLLVLLAACASKETLPEVPEVTPEKHHYYYDLQVYRGHLYATSPWGLDVFSLEGDRIFRAGGFETPGEAQALAIADERLYLSDTTGKLYILDVSTPSIPRLVEELLLNQTAQQILIAGKRAYLASVASGVVILDLQELTSELYKPKVYSYPKGIFLKNDELYIADFTMRLYVTRVENKTIKLVASAPTSSVAHDVLVFGGYAYVASSDGGVDVYRTFEDELLHVQNLPLPGFALRLGRYRDYLLVTLADRGVALLSIGGDGSLMLQQIYDTPGNAYGIAISGDRAYVADYDGGIVVLDLSQLPELVPVAVIKPEVSG
jgi:hypothetical protein